MDMVNAALQGMVDGGTLRSGEYERMVILTYNRTLKEFEAPFSAGSEGSPLELESSSEVARPDPFWPEHEQSGDAQTFGAAYEEFFRAAYGPSLFGALDADRSPKNGSKSPTRSTTPCGRRSRQTPQPQYALARRAPVHRQEVRRLKRIAEVNASAIRALQHFSKNEKLECSSAEMLKTKYPRGCVPL
jgi:hypothetical protein